VSDLGGTAAMAVVLGLGAVSAFMWTATQVAALVGTGRFVAVNLPASGRALFALRNHLRDPAAAWPPDIASQLPGPLVYWPSMLAVAGIASWLAWRLWRWRQARTGGAGPLGIAGAGFARSHNLDRLAVAAPTKGRLTLGYAGRSLIAAEPQTSLAVVGPTGCGKTAGFAIPALLEWEGPVIATSVKNDLLDPTLERRRQLGKVWIYDPTGKSGHPSHRWTPLSSCATWAGAMRIAAWLCEAAQPKIDTVTDGDYWYTQARKALAPYLHAAAIDGRSMADVVRWIDAQESTTVEKILRRSAGVDAALDRALERGRVARQAGQAAPRDRSAARQPPSAKASLRFPVAADARSWQQRTRRQVAPRTTGAARRTGREAILTRPHRRGTRAGGDRRAPRTGTLDALIAARIAVAKRGSAARLRLRHDRERARRLRRPRRRRRIDERRRLHESRNGSPGRTRSSCRTAHEQARLRPVLNVLLQQAIRTAYETANASTAARSNSRAWCSSTRPATSPRCATSPTYASTARSHGITLVSIWQDLAQIKAVYGDRAQTVLNNHQAKLFGTGIADDATLDYVSRLVGDERRTEVNLSGTCPATYHEPADALRRLHDNAHLSELRPWYQPRPRARARRQTRRLPRRAGRGGVGTRRLSQTAVILGTWPWHQ
jgi:type IV secretion system protein VirD4